MAMGSAVLQSRYQDARLVPTGGVVELHSAVEIRDALERRYVSRRLRRRLADREPGQGYSPATYDMRD